MVFQETRKGSTKIRADMNLRMDIARCSGIIELLKMYRQTGKVQQITNPARRDQYLAAGFQTKNGVKENNYE
jgi:hypothetical protein